MFIQTEYTPNPNTMKFLPGKVVMGAGSVEIRTKDAAKKSPLALKLYEIDGVSSILLGGNFVAVSKDASSEWDVLTPYIIEALTLHFTSQLPVMYEGIKTLSEPLPPEMLDSISQQIVEILDTRVRPAVAQDGGDIEFESFLDGVVYLRMKGACSGCPSSLITLKNGISNTLRHYVPEVKEVQAITV